MNLKQRKLSGADARNQTGRRPGSDLRARYDRAVALARGHEATGNKVDAERFYQQADHLLRLLNGEAA